MAVKIFISYAQEDEELLNRLKTHLMPLKRQGIIDIWYDRNISAGTEWKKAISDQLNAAQIILLLISPDFMASDYLYGIEVKRAMERHERGDARVIPVLLRSSYWKIERFNKLKALPIAVKLEAKPVISSCWHNLDEALVNVVEGIHEAALELTRSCNVLFYNALEGKSEFYSIDDHGNKFLLKEYGWQKIWTHIIPGNFTGGKHTDLLFYSNSTGQAEFYKTISTGDMKDVRFHPGWYNGWTQIIPGKFTNGKYTDLLFYSASTGEGEFFTTDGHGEISSLKKNPRWSKDWTHIVSGKFTDGRYTDLLFHNTSTGRVKIVTTNGRGEVKDCNEHPNWQRHSIQVVYLSSI